MGHYKQQVQRKQRQGARAGERQVARPVKVEQARTTKQQVVTTINPRREMTKAEQYAR